MKKLGVVLATLLVLTLVIASVSCGGERTISTPTPTLIVTSTSTQFPTSTPSPEPTQNGCIGQLFSYHIMEGDTREVTVTCPECGAHVTHNYTIDQKYICETCGTAFDYYTGIALIKDGAAFAPLGQIRGVLGTLGFQNHIKTTIAIEPLAGTRFWEGTAPNTYYWDTDTDSIEWSEAALM